MTPLPPSSTASKPLPGGCREAGSSLWLSAALSLPTHHPIAPALKMSLLVPSGRGPALRNRGLHSSCPSSCFPVLGLNSCPHELLIHSSANFPYTVLSISSFLFMSSPHTQHLLMPGDPTQIPPPLCSQLQSCRQVSALLSLLSMPPRIVLGNPDKAELMNSK